MSKDEKNGEEAAISKRGSGSEQVPSKKKPKSKAKLGILAAIVVVVIAAGGGFWAWHETPGFCATACHDSMNTYLVTYEQQDNAAGVDKWGNEVANTHAMLAVSHQESDLACLDCHEPSLPQQLGELGETITGSYELPLVEVNTEALMSNANKGDGMGDQFCLKSGCHVTTDGQPVTRETLTAATADMQYNPHSWQHGELNCSECHKSHRASVLLCTQCHDAARDQLPEGWVDYQTSRDLQSQTMNAA